MRIRRRGQAPACCVGRRADETLIRRHCGVEASVYGIDLRRSGRTGDQADEAQRKGKGVIAAMLETPLMDDDYIKQKLKIQRCWQSTHVRIDGREFL